MGLICVSEGTEKMPDVLNFGCGNSVDKNAVNIDISLSDSVIEDNKGVWLFEGKWDNPHEFSSYQFNKIYAKDVLEHFHPEDIGNILYCFRCSLNYKGLLNVVVPDFEKMARIISESQGKELDLESLKTFRQIELDWMAPYRHDGIGHRSIWTRAIAKHRIEMEGFEVKRIGLFGENSLEITAVRI